MSTTTTLTGLCAHVADRLYRRWRWVRRYLAHMRRAAEYADLGLCCIGWYFEHTPDCLTPNLPRGCSDCSAVPGTDHLYPCSWHYSEPPPDVLDAASWPDAARWPGHPINDGG